MALPAGINVRRNCILGGILQHRLKRVYCSCINARLDFLIATESGKTDILGKALLKRDEVVYAGKSIGQDTIDESGHNLEKQL